MRNEGAATLRRELGRHVRGRGKRYPVELKRRVVAYALVQRAAGASYKDVADELGLAFETVRRWCMKSGREPSTALVPVEIVGEAAAVPALAIVSPSGFRLEGLELLDAVAAMRALG